MGTPLGARAEGEKPLARPAQLRSTSKTSGRLSTDSIGWYLSNIGRVPLLLKKSNLLIKCSR